MNLWTPYFFPLLFLFLWVMILIFLSRLGGWSRLAREYRFYGEFRGQKLRLQSIRMRRGTKYNNCINIGVNMQGLYLSVFFLCRPGHPALFIRWSDITVEERKRWGFTNIELRFRKAKDIIIGIRPGLGQKLAEAAGDYWPETNPLIYTPE